MNKSVGDPKMVIFPFYRNYMIDKIKNLKEKESIYKHNGLRP